MVKSVGRLKVALFLCLGLCLALQAWAQGSGKVEGKIAKDDGAGLGGVTVVLNELGQVQISNSDGSFTFKNVPAGTYTVSFSLGENQETEQVEVKGGETAQVGKTVAWDVSFADTITVFSASRRRERVVDAPASVTLITPEEIQAETVTGQLPKALEFAPGVEITQSGVHDFNLNARGFNSSLNRRVQVIVDGQDPAVHFLGSTEWAYLSNMTDIASVELVRGPSSALYGANAFNGVLNMVTKAPRDNQGGSVNLGGGELSSLRGDVLWAFGLGNEWYGKVSGAYSEGETNYVSRVSSTEYAGLPRERGVATPDYDTTHANLRLDKYFGDGDYLLTGDAVSYEGTGGVVVTGIGRVFVRDTERTSLRFNFSGSRFNVLAYQNNRETPNQLALASGGRLDLDTQMQHAEVQGNYDWKGGKIRLVGGASYRETEIDTATDTGIQTLIFAPVDSDSQAAFAQVDFELSDNVKLVLAGRYDDSTLHEAQFSPKAAIVWNVADDHSLRFSYNEAFQVANYSEFFLDAPTAFPGAVPITSINLAGIENALCRPFGISCGFDTPVRVRALGNKDLELEEITAFELGYTGIFGSKAFLTVDYYQNQLENFITDLIPNPGGRINPNFGPYRAPAGHPAAALLLATLRASLPASVFPFLSNNVDGRPIFALASYTNAGEVDTQGVDLGLNYYITQQWVFDFSYSWFDFDVKSLGVVNQPILPNAPEHKFSAGIGYTADNWGFSFKYRWVDDFLWEAGAFAGPVPSYSLVNIGANYKVNENIEIGLNISNAFDEDHYESFGGELVERRALGNVRFVW